MPGPWERYGGAASPPAAGTGAPDGGWSPLPSPPRPVDPYQVDQEERARRADMRAMEDQARQARAEGRAVADRANDATDRSFNRANVLRDDFGRRPQVIAYNNAIRSYNSAINAGPDAAGDINVIYAFAKIMDPESVVREGETQMAQQTANYAQQIGARFGFEVGDGGRLAPEVRNHLLRELHNRVVSYNQAYGQTRGEFERLANAYGIDPSLVVGPHLGAPFRDNIAARLGANPEASSIPIMPQERPIPEGWVVEGRNADGSRYGRRADGTPWAEIIGDAAPPDITDARGADGLLGSIGEGIDAFVRGAADTATLGFADELSGNADTIFGGGDRDANIARQRAIDAYDAENNPWARGIGQIAGAVALPFTRGGSIRRAIGEGAAYGGAYGFGSGEGYTERGLNALLGAGLGGVAGGAVHQAAPVVENALTSGINRFMNWRARRAAGAADAQSINREVVLAGERQGIPIRQPDARPETRAEFAAAEASPHANQVIARTLAADQAALRERIAGVAPGGVARDELATGQMTQGVMERHADRTSARAGRYYRQVERLAPGIVARPDALRREAQALIAAAREGGDNAAASEIGLIESMVQDFEQVGVSVRSLQAQRARLRERVRQAGIDPTRANTAMDRIMIAAANDLDAALQMADPRARQALDAAERVWRERVEFRREFARLFTGPNVSPEAAASRLMSMIGRRGNSEGFARVWREFEPAERADMAATVLENAGRNRAGEFSFAQFATSIQNYSPNALRTIFGEDGARAVADLRIIARAKADTASAINRSRTGVVAEHSPAAATFRTVVMAAAGGSVGGIPGALATGAAGAALSRRQSTRMARLLLNPDFTRWMRQTPDTVNPRVIDAHFARLERIASRSPALAADVQGFRQLLIEASRSPMAQTRTEERTAR